MKLRGMGGKGGRGVKRNVAEMKRGVTPVSRYDRKVLFALRSIIPFPGNNPGKVKTTFVVDHACILYPT